MKSNNYKFNFEKDVIKKILWLIFTISNYLTLTSLTFSAYPGKTA